MTTEIVNLTHQAVHQAIEDVLEQYPSHPYQQAFAHPELRQQLIVQVLNQSPNRFVLVEDSPQADHSVTDGVSQVLSDDSTDIKSIIQQEIEQIIQERTEWIKQHIPEQQ